MATSNNETDALTLIRTKLQRPRLPGDLVPRRRLLDRLKAGSDRKLTLVSAMAGTGKTTLLAQWLEECPRPSAWLSLDEHDNDPVVFLYYLIAAVRTAFPHSCGKTFALLSAPKLPPVRAITAALINELDDLAVTPSQQGPAAKAIHSVASPVLAFDDYHHITEPVIHEILSSLIEHLPQGLHLALATRADPPLPLARWRARSEMTEVRSVDLRFTLEEAHALLERTAGRDLNPEMVRLLEEKTEGWVVGLRLAGLSMRTRPDLDAFVRGFRGTSIDLITEYLLDEVLAQQSPEVQDALLRTSILDRFCAPLFEAVCWGGTPAPGSSSGTAVPATEVPAEKGGDVIDWIAKSNLFLVLIDKEDRWYRYHHLFSGFLQRELSQRTSGTDTSELHTRAGAWFAQHGFIDEAMHHLLAAGDTAAAAALVAEHRYALMNRVQWPHLDRYLQQFSPDILEQYPDLLMLQRWLLYQQGRRVELPAALEQLEAALPGELLSPEEVNHLQGEISALRSNLYYLALDPEHALVAAQQALETTPRELWSVRILARLLLAGVLQMRGDSSEAYATIYSGFEEEETQSNAFKATLVMTVCFAHWLDADLKGMAQAARQCIALSQQSDIPHILNYGHYHLGRVCYQRNDLAAAEEQFTMVMQEPYLNYGHCYAHSACGLALVHQAQGRSDSAQAVIESAHSFMLETGNTTLMPVIQAFQAEIALRQGQIALAGQWAVHLDPVPPLEPMVHLFSLHLTLVKVWLAQDTPASRGQAADLLERSREFVETTHNTRFLIEVLALQAMLQDRRDERQTALELLGQAVALAEPGGFIRLFVDLGSPMASLLEQLRLQGMAVEYITSILTALATTHERRTTKDDANVDARPRTDIMPWSSGLGASSTLVESLTPRELDVLALLGRRLTNKEIAAELVISPETVKTHTLHIYRKLDVRNRRQAAARARELGLLSPNIADS
jgi:LuxR family maltose regulon positive regulatory protein